MTTKFYVPAMYFRNIVGSHQIDVDQWMELAKEKPSGVSCAELVVDHGMFGEYKDRLKEVFDFCTGNDIEIPVIRISCVGLYLKDSAAVLEDLSGFLETVAAIFGDSIHVQLETLSAWQVYEARNGLVLDPESLPAGYKYHTYAKYVLDAVAAFCALCGDVGVIPVIEPRVGHVISNPDSIMRLVDKDGLPFKLVFDVSHMEFQGINTCDAWDVLKEYTAIVHVSDTDVTSAHHVPVGTGQVPWKSILAYTGKHKEVGFLGVEIFADSEDEASVKSTYADNIAKVRSLIKKYRLGGYFE